MNIKTRKNINKLKDKLINLWYFSMKPLAKLIGYLDDTKYKKLKTKSWNEKKIKRQLNKQIQKLVLYQNKSKYEKCFYLIDRYIYDVQREFGGMYNVKYLFENYSKSLRNGYLSKYVSYGSKYNPQEFIDKWLPIILDICKENNLIVTKINKDDLCPDNKYWKYDSFYKQLNNVWRVDCNELHKNLS